MEWWTVRNSNSIRILSIQTLRGVVCIEQFSSLTRADHGTAWNASAAGLQVLRSRLACRDLSNTGPNNKQEQLCHLALTTSAVAPVRLERQERLPRQARLSMHCGWHRTWEVFGLPWSVKSTIRKTELSWHSRPGSLWASLVGKLIGVVVQSPSNKLLK